MEISAFQSEFEHSFKHFDRQLDQDIAVLLRQGGHSLVLAESMTGGMIAERITRTTGCSDYFIGGIVCYNPMLKIQLCGVTPATLRKHGQVSEPVVLEMAKGVQKWGSSTCSLAVTGLAGSYSIPQEEGAGTVYIGLIVQGTEKAQLFKLEGDRQSIRIQATQAALVLLREALRRERSLQNG